LDVIVNVHLEGLVQTELIRECKDTSTFEDVQIISEVFFVFLHSYFFALLNFCVGIFNITVYLLKKDKTPPVAYTFFNCFNKSLIPQIAV